jgi:hypothetical protein
MKTIQLTFLLILLILAGCAPTKFINSLPSDSPKGYAFFFCKNNRDYCSHKQKLSIVKSRGEYLFAGKVSYNNRKKDSYKTGYMIAKTPGSYYVSTSTGTYYFNIEEGMVTPIEIKLNVFIAKVMMPWGPIDQRIISADLLPPGKPVPIAEYNIK